MTEWEHARPLIMAALEHDDQGTTIEDVERSIANGDAVLFCGKQSAMVLKVLEVKSLHIFLAGGNLEELRSGDPQLVEMARAFDCTQITIMGRRGWERALRDLDYQPVLAKEVPNG